MSEQRARKTTRRAFGSVTVQKKGGKAMKTLRVQYRDPNTGKWVTSRQHGLPPFATNQKQAADAWLSTVQATILAGTWKHPDEERAEREAAAAQAEAEALTVRQWFDKWITRHDTGTAVSYTSTFNTHVLPYWEGRTLKSITRDDVDKIIDGARVKKKRHGQSRVTGGQGAANNTLIAVRSFFNDAVEDEEGGLEYSPVKYKQPKKSKAQPVDLDDPNTVASPDEVVKLAEALPERYRVAVYLGAWCALRIGEVQGLQRQDFVNLDDPKNAALIVRRQWLAKAQPPKYSDPKAGSRGRVNIPAAIVPIIQKHLDDYTPKRKSGPLIPSTVDDTRPFSRSRWESLWRERRESVKPGFTFRNLRHTALTQFARTGATQREIMAQGRHKDPNVALTYQEWTAERQRELTDKMNNVIPMPRAAGQ